MRLLQIEFKNCVWRGIRLEGRLQNWMEGDPHEFAIGWHYTQSCFDLTEYYHKESGPTRGKHFFFKSFSDVELHMSKWASNLPSFREEVNLFIAEMVAEVI